MNLHITGHGLTNVGKKRENNEDYFIVDNDKLLFLIADGLGGHNAGEVASKMSCSLFQEEFSINNKNIKNSLIETTKRINKNIYSESINKKEYEKMGTTLVALKTDKKCAHIINVGDSRAYYFFNNELLQITNDHSVVNMLLKQGVINKNEAAEHPYKNQLTKAVGLSENIEPDYFKIELNPGAQILMCTDGLWEYIKEELIKKILQQELSGEEKTKLLVDEANKIGADNITAILIEIN